MVSEMGLVIVNDTILKPTPSAVGEQNPHTNARIPLTIFDRAAFDLHVTILYAFRPPMPSNEALMQGLAEALNIYPHLAGRFAVDEEGRPCIVLNGAGVRVVETEIAGTTVAERLPFEPSHELTNLHPPVEGAEALLQIQLNRYACGGLVIGQTAHHRVADGQSMSCFFAAWARLVRGLDVEVLPYHNRAAVSVPRDPPASEFNHRAIEFTEAALPAATPDSTSSSNIVNLVIHYPAEFVTRLKKLVCQGGSRYSTFECLLTHMWKKLTLARGLDGDETTQVRVAVNGRARMRPAVPMEYFGNLVLWAYPRLRVQDLVAGTHASVARAIHDAVARVDAAYFQSFVDFGAELQLSNSKDLDSSAAATGNMLCPNLEVDSWLRFEFHELDFGGGAPCAFLPAELPVEGLFLFVPSYKEKGSVDVFVAVADDHVDTFKQIAYLLD